jgi:tetratricopeptide (TPR) repeat protein
MVWNKSNLLRKVFCLRGFSLYFLVSLFTGNPMIAILAVVIFYLLVDRFYLGFLPDFTKVFRRNRDIKGYLREIKFNPQNARAAFSLGMLYFEKKRYEEALKFLEHPRLKDDSSANYYNYLGMTLIELKRAEEGEAYIIKALEMDSKLGYGLPYVYLINTQMSKKTPDTGRLRELEYKVQREANTENLYRVGMIYRRAGDRDKAREFFTKALEEYSYCPRGLKRLHRKWAILSRIRKIM